MALMLPKTYQALLASGAPEEQAHGAAEEIAAYQSRFAKIATDLTILKWMIAGLYPSGRRAYGFSCASPRRSARSDNRAPAARRDW
jgi:hypothetical protein